jgi:uncharacterized lipoprotein YmbA
MKEMPFFRGLPVILAIVAIFFIVGCLGRSPSPRFYALSPMQEGQVISKRKSPAHHAVIGIGPVKVADYLDESQIVTRTGDNQLVKAEFHRWAGSLNDNLANVLADNLGFLLPTDRINRYPWRTSVPIDYQVVVDVVRLDGRLGEAAWLVARWSVLSGPEKKLLKMSRSSIREPVSGADYGAVVAAQSRALARLSQDIAEAIQGAGKIEADKPTGPRSQPYRRNYTLPSKSKVLSTWWRGAGCYLSLNHGKNQ